MGITEPALLSQRAVKALSVNVAALPGTCLAILPKSAKIPTWNSV